MGDRLRQHIRTAQGRLRWHARDFRATDLDNVFLVIGATDDAQLNRKIHAEAQAQKLLCNIADRPALCNFILPAVVQRGDLSIAISTAGQSPAFAKWLRKRLEKEFGEEYAFFLRLMGAIRRKLLAGDHAPEAHKHIFERLIEGELLERVRRDEPEMIDRLLMETLLPADSGER